MAYGSKIRFLHEYFLEEMGLQLWSHYVKKTFLFILKHLVFDDAEIRQERWKKDRFAAFREFFESFNLQCQKMLVHDFYLALGETYPLQTQVSF